MNQPFDESGMVAAPGLLLKDPWTILPSSRHKGHYYFLNTETKKSSWTLDSSWLLDVTKNDAVEKNLPRLEMPSRVEMRRTAQVTSVTSAHADETKIPQFGREAKTTSAPLLMYKRQGASTMASRGSIDAASLEVVEGLGQGGFADVVQVRETTTGKMFAMKVIAKKRLRSAQARRNISLEFRLLTEMDSSPFVLRAHSCFESATNVFFITDLCSGGDLYSHVVSRDSADSDEWGLPEKEARVILAELAIAVEHVHGQGYLHKDIKMENVMLDGSGHVKLVDFGLAEAIQGEDTEVRVNGSWSYMAPEMIRDGTGGRHTDWWAYGIVAFELLTGCTPWSSFDDMKVIMQEVLYREFDFTGVRSPSAKSFLKGLLRRNHTARLGRKSDRDVLNADFFEGIDLEATKLQKNVPAFVPSEINLKRDVKEAALASYRSRSEFPRPGEAIWYLGLGVVSKHPRCAGF